MGETLLMIFLLIGMQLRVRVWRASGPARLDISPYLNISCELTQGQERGLRLHDKMDVRPCLKKKKY
jgi:hypothetical protein